EIPKEISSLIELEELDLGFNSFSGSLDLGFNVSGLRIIDLSFNNLSGSLPPNIGSLPQEIGNIKAVTKMDLSMNQFSNDIPREIGGLQNLAQLSLRHNKFQGSIPDSMSNIESNLIGSGSFGSAYKGVLRSGTAIAVKVFNLDEAFKSFDTECEVLRSLRHRNVVKVITSCSNLDFKALVLEYIPNGSLEKYLYSHNYFLDIKQRLSIMIDVACALEYLHHGCSLPVILCDVKPSNVLLDEDMVAHLSDFGISKLLGEDQGDLYSKTLATFGKKPNEFEGDLSLKQWARYSLPDDVMEVVDANLLTSTGSHLKKELDVVASIMKVPWLLIFLRPRVIASMMILKICNGTLKLYANCYPNSSLKIQSSKQLAMRASRRKFLPKLLMDFHIELKKKKSKTVKMRVEKVNGRVVKVAEKVK
ncbi:receptor kinase-like protein Xa21, partial [Capsicum annuum]|uniref:receptor kinase-like protein Xa21 n=1 Tax=Capsicum annuum TaxID=4072 RepID=UPI001FB07E32